MAIIGSPMSTAGHAGKIDVASVFLAACDVLTVLLIRISLDESVLFRFDRKSSTVQGRAAVDP